MTDKETQNAKSDFQTAIVEVKPIELERILSLYGLKKQEYCNLRGKTKSWFHNVLRKKKLLSYLDVKVLTDSIGTDTFYMLLDKVRGKNE
jgi:hypothetical protein